MSNVNFNRGFPLQLFRPFGSPSGNVPPVGQTNSGSATASVSFSSTATGTSTRTGSATANVAFASTATGTSTRTGSATASVIFAATATGSQIEKGGFSSPSDTAVLGGNAIGINQSMLMSQW
jgi:hypothetical protein